MDRMEILFKLKLEFIQKFFNSSIKMSYRQEKNILDDESFQDIVSMTANTIIESNLQLSPELRYIAAKIKATCEEEFRLFEKYYYLALSQMEHREMFDIDRIGKILLSYEDCFDYQPFIDLIKNRAVKNCPNLDLSDVIIKHSLKIAEFWLSVGGTVNKTIFKRLDADDKIDKSLLNKLYELNEKNKTSH